jgi:TonB family protein
MISFFACVNAALAEAPQQSAGVPACQLPPAAIRLNQQGTVVIGGTVTTDGRLTAPYVIKSSGFHMIDKAALDCMATRHYSPETRNGVPVETFKKIAARMRLVNSSPPFEAPDSVHTCKIDMARADLEKVQGFVQVKFSITENGDVQNVSMLRSSGNDAFDKTVAECVAGWKYDAKITDGKSVKTEWAALIRVDAQDGIEMVEEPNSLYRCSLLSRQTDSPNGTPGMAAVIEHYPFQTKAPKGDALLQSTGNSFSDAASLACVKAWETKPAFAVPFPGYFAPFPSGTAIRDIVYAFGILWNGSDGQLLQ